MSVGVLGLCGLAACAPQVPDSAAGVGDATSPFNPPPPVEAGTTIFDKPLVPSARLSDESTTDTALSSPVRIPANNDDIARETATALNLAAANSGTAPLQASPSNPAPGLVNNPGISDENDFDAVSARQTIESDAARLAALRSQYEVVSPTALPDRPVDTGPNIVKYALSTSHPRGVRMYNRVGLNLAARSQRNCAAYLSAEEAQAAFLEMGGPKRDRKALDPDGDGYACAWDPSPYRLAVQGQ